MSLVGRYIKVYFEADNVTKYVYLENKCPVSIEFLEVPAPLQFEDLLQCVISNTEEKEFLHFKDFEGNILPNTIIISLVNQFIYSACFSLKNCTVPKTVPVRRCDAALGSLISITSEELKKYIEINEGQCIIDCFNRSNSLTDRLRRLLVRILVKFIVSQFGEKPSKREKLKVANLAVELFPCYKTNNTYGGAETFFDPDQNTGYLVSQLKNTLFSKKRYQSSEPCSSNNLAPASTSNEGINEEEEITDEVLDFFKKVTLPEQKLELIAKLRLTVSARKSFLQVPRNIGIIFPFFFLDAELVSIDFNIQYPKIKNISNNWVAIESSIQPILNLKGLSIEPLNDWPELVKIFLALIKLLTAPPEQNISSRCNFVQTAEKFIKFHDNNKSLDEVNTSSTLQPIIIATGTSNNDIQQYFISIGTATYT